MCNKPAASNNAAVRRNDRTARTLRYLLDYAAAHILAVVTSSLAFTVTVILWSDDTLDIFATLIGAISIFLVAITMGALLLLPITLFAFPLAIMITRRYRRPAAVAAIGGVAGLLLGLPIFLLTLSLNEAAPFLSSPMTPFAEAVPTLGATAVLTGAAFGWLVARLRGGDKASSDKQE